jgi:hypothetical protein
VATFDAFRGATAYSTKSVMRGDQPILLVVRDSDGDWQFLDGQPVDEAEGVAVHLAHIVDAYPELSGLADLPVGWAAERESADDEWKRYPWPHAAE